MRYFVFNCKVVVEVLGVEGDLVGVRFTFVDSVAGILHGKNVHLLVEKSIRVRKIYSNLP